MQPGRRRIASRRQAIPALEPPALPAPDSWRPAAKSGGLAALPALGAWGVAMLAPATMVSLFGLPAPGGAAQGALAMLASLLGVFDVLHV